MTTASCTFAAPAYSYSWAQQTRPFALLGGVADRGRGASAHRRCSRLIEEPLLSSRWVVSKRF